MTHVDQPIARVTVDPVSPSGYGFTAFTVSVIKDNGRWLWACTCIDPTHKKILTSTSALWCRHLDMVATHMLDVQDGVIHAPWWSFESAGRVDISCWVGGVWSFERAGRVDISYWVGGVWTQALEVVAAIRQLVLTTSAATGYMSTQPREMFELWTNTVAHLLVT